MQTVSYTPGQTRAAEPSVIALGFFDGVHLGHRALLRMARERADALGLSLSVFTFPSEDEMMKRSAQRLYDTPKKLSLLASLGVDTVYMCPLSLVAAFSAEEFVEKCLVRDLRAEATVCGFNYRFGKGAAGDCEALAAYMRALGKESVTLPPMHLGEELLSSSAVRAHLCRGEVALANRMLGDPFSLSGRVESGDGRGRVLGIPTVNIPIAKNRLALPAGVYATAVRLKTGIFASVTNLGTCPTFGERSIHAEAHLLSFSGDLYGQDIEIEFLEKLRDERVFESKEMLIKQINVDKIKALEVYEAWLEAGRN